MGISRSEFQDLTEEQLSDWYTKSRPTLEALNSQLRCDLAELERVHPDVTFVRTRIKSREAFLNKARKLQRSPEDLAKKPWGPGIDIHDIITDLVGGRVVLYFEQDRYAAFDFFHLRPRFRVKEIELYDCLTPGSPLQHTSVSELRAKIDSVGYELSSQVKPSGYESLHLIVQYSDRVLLRRGSAPSDPGDVRGSSDLAPKGDVKERVGNISFEIQIRSVLQDVWAQVEHSIQYAARKSSARPDEAPEQVLLLREHFLSQKLVVKGLERYQNIIRSIAPTSDVSYRQLRGASLTLSGRFDAFALEDRTALDRAARPKGDDALSYLSSFNELIRLGNIFQRKYAHPFWTHSLPRSPEVWARQRLLLLEMGFLASFGDFSVRRCIQEFFANRWEDYPAASSMTAIEIYMFVRTGDRRMVNATSDEHLRRLFQDPLVAYRQAGAFISEYNDLREAARAMDEAIRNFQRVGVVGEDDHGIINGAHLHRRFASYTWGYYIEDRPTPINLERSLERINVAAEAAGLFIATDRSERDPLRPRLPLDPEAAEIEQRKVLADYVTIQFFHKVYQLLIPIEGILPFRDALLQLDSQLVECLLDPRKINDRSHALQARAIADWVSGNREAAYQSIGRAHEIVQQGGRPAYQVEVIQRLSDFLWLNELKTG